MTLHRPALRHRGEQGAIKSLDDLDLAIAQVGILDCEIERIEQDLDLQVKRAKASALQKQAEPEADRKRILALIQTYVEAHRAEALGKRKSRRLNFGKFGWRVSSKLALPKRESDEMEALVAMVDGFQQNRPEEFGSAIITIQRYLTKGGLSGLTDDALQELGLERESQDVFFVQPDRERLEELEERSESDPRGIAAVS